MERFQNKYRISSARAQRWDYRSAGSYFITVCTKEREHYFGEVQDGKMQLSSLGIIADILWYEIKNHTTNIDLGEFIVMPNHIHGVLTINNFLKETGHALSLQFGDTRCQNPGKNSISSIVGSYKSAVSKHAHRLGFDFEWQPRFHDNIIRDELSMERISSYIRNNPLNWKEDKFYR